MSRGKSLLKNTLIITFGKVCTQLVTFFLLPLYTGILSTEEYGIVDLLNTLVSLLLPIITFQVEMAIFRELVEVRNSKYQKKSIISSGVISVLLQCIIFLIIFFVISPFVHNNYKYFLVVNIIAAIFNSIFLQIARGLGDNTKYAFASFLSAVSTVIFNVIFLVVIKLGVNGMLLGTLLGQVISAIYMFFSLKIYKYLSIFYFDRKTVKVLWKYSLPLIPNSISWWVFNASDRVIVSILLGLSATGLLSTANKFSGILVTIYGIFNLGWTESLSLHINDKDIKKYFNKMFVIIINFFSSLVIGMIACMPFVFPILINKKFNGAYGLIPILILSSLFNIMVTCLGTIYAAKKNTKEVANTSIIAAIINIVSHLLLIKFIGLYAAAVSTFLAYFIMSFNRLINVGDRYFSVKFNKKNTKITVVVLIIVFIAYYINNFYLNIISLLLAIMFALYINKKSINIILNIIKRKA